MQGQYRGDFTRDTFAPLKHFSRVLIQQGRVQVDADLNEQIAILLRYLQTLAADLIGRHGGPADHWGFAIAPAGLRDRDFRIGPGHYYVDGILCEVDATPVSAIVQQANTKQVQVSAAMVDGVVFQPGQYVEVFSAAQPPNAANPILTKITAVDQVLRTLTLDTDVQVFQAAAAVPRIRRVATYLTQPDYPVPAAEQLRQGTHQVYLDVWERHLTYVEDDGIREVALGGPDTAARAKVVWQVRVMEAAGATALSRDRPCLSVDELRAAQQPDNRGRLKAMAKQDTPSTDPCVVSPSARYRGPENQLYRVEIHRAGDAWDGKTAKISAATFKWSRENGSVVFPISKMATDSAAGTTTLTLENLGKDDRLTLSVGDWVEIQDDDSVLQNRADKLLQVHSIDRMSMTVILSGIPGSSVGQVPAKHPLLRRWEQTEGDPTEGGLQLGDDGAALIIEDGGDNWLGLEDGVQIQFQPADSDQPANHYRTGDYWLIPARTATGDVEWPTALDSQGKPMALAVKPHGVEHHYAPLAVISLDASGTVKLAHDCRLKFDGLAKPLRR